MYKNMCQRAIAKEVGISRNGISENLLKFQSTLSILDGLIYIRSRKLMHRIVQKTNKECKIPANTDCKTRVE